MKNAFSENVRRLAKEKGKSLKDIEKELGFTTGSFSRWISHEPSVSTVMKIAEYFGVEVKELLSGKKQDVCKTENEDTTNEIVLSELLKNASIKSIKVEYSFSD